jgi:hypothetical protein
MGASHTLLRASLARRLGSTPYLRRVRDQRSGFYVYVSIEGDTRIRADISNDGYI